MDKKAAVPGKEYCKTKNVIATYRRSPSKIHRRL